LHGISLPGFLGGWVRRGAAGRERRNLVWQFPTIAQRRHPRNAMAVVGRGGRQKENGRHIRAARSLRSFRGAALILWIN